MERSSGKCTIHFSSLQGQATSAWPGASGAPTECRAGTKKAFVASILPRTSVPIVAMMRMEATT